jgi:hypothetical protein
MEGAEVHRLVGEVIGVADDCRDREVLVAAVATVARLQAWLDGRNVRLAVGLAEVAARPSRLVAEAARTPARDADRVLDRARTVEAIPALGEALDAGSVSGGHVDAVGRVLRQLEPSHRDALAASAGWLVKLARESTPGELQKALSVEMDHVRAEDGMSRLERQRRATRLDTWIDAEGMWCLRGQFDPETGLKLHSRLTNTVSALFAEKCPEDCPMYPLERQSFLRAHALVALTEGRGPRSAAPEIVPVLDLTNPHPDGTPTIDWGLPVELPAEVLQRLFDTAEVHPIVVRGGVVLHAPGRLDLGRSTRLANRAQRRALRALYATCAIPGCETRYDLCKLHHITSWEHGGATDLHNLLPLCVRHHHDVHEGGWQLELGTDRSLTVTYPDGTTQTTGPATRRHANRPPRPPPPPPNQGLAHDEPLTLLRC